MHALDAEVWSLHRHATFVSMDSEFERRAEERKGRIWGGVAASPAELDARDLEFWLSVDPSARIGAACALHEEVRRLRNDGPVPRLPGSAGGVRRLEG